MNKSKIQWILFFVLSLTIGSLVYFSFQKSDREFLEGSTGIDFPKGTRVIILDDDLQHLILGKLKIRRKHVASFTKKYSFKANTETSHSLMSPLLKNDNGLLQKQATLCGWFK